MSYYIYTLKDYTNKIKYVGQTINPDARERAHRNSKKPKHTYHILTAIDDSNEARDMEMHLIEKHDCYLFGWNGSPGGEGFSGYSRKGIGGVKKNNTPWNKGVKGCFSDETLAKMRSKRRGVRHSSKLNEETVRSIRKLYDEKPHISGVGEVQQNGRVLSYHQAFCKEYHNEYGLTPNGLKKVILKEVWINV